MQNSSKHMTVCVVIPAYNEAEHIAACLAAIAAQTVKPDEVIVVNNNSSDATVQIAASFEFVRIVHEPRQGIAYARDAGFDAATSDVIMRTDADSVPAPLWIESAVSYLKTHPNTSAISGRYYISDIAYPRAAGLVQVIMYQCLQKMMTGTYFLCGANLAIRRSAWRDVHNRVSHRIDIDEDIDLTLCLRTRRHRVGYVLNMIVSTPFASERLTPRALARYLSTWPRDYSLHGMWLRAGFIRALNYLILAVVVPFVVVSGWLPGRSE